MRTLAVIEGFAGGHHLSKNFKKSATEHGYKIIKDPKVADIIVAHSAGCYLVPSNNNVDKIILIGPPYWPGRSLVNRSFKKAKNEHKDLKTKLGKKYLIKIRVLQTYYVFRRPSATFALRKNTNTLDFMDKLDSSKMIIVRNIDDDFCSALIKSAIAEKSCAYVEIEGQHDDYYTNPEPYLDLLESPDFKLSGKKL